MVLGMLTGLWVVHLMETKRVMPVGSIGLSGLLLTAGLLLVIGAVILNTIEVLITRLQREIKEAVDRLQLVVVPPSHLTEQNPSYKLTSGGQSSSSGIRRES